MSEMKLIMENWNGFVNEQEDKIETIGQLYKYFTDLEPTKLQRTLTKYGSLVSKIVGASAGGLVATMTGGSDLGSGAAAKKLTQGLLAEKTVEAVLSAAVLALSNVEDGTYADDSVVSYFDLDDNLTLFMRELEQKKAGSDQPSKPELEALKAMVSKIKELVQGGVDPDQPVADILRGVTTEAILDAKLKRGDYSGKVNLTPAS